MKNEDETQGGSGFPTPPWERPPGRRFTERGSRPRLRFAGSYPELRHLENRRYPYALGPDTREGWLSKYKYTSTDTLNLLDTPNEILSRSGTLGTFNPKDHPPQFPTTPYKKLIASVHLEDPRDERLHRHPSRLRKLSVELHTLIEKFNFYKGEVCWYIEDEDRGGSNLSHFIKDVIAKIALIMHSIKFRQVTDKEKANLLFCLRVIRSGDPNQSRYRSGYTTFLKGNSSLTRVTVDTNPDILLRDEDHPMKMPCPPGYHHPAGPALYASSGKNAMPEYSIPKTKLHSTADYFAPNPYTFDKCTTSDKYTTKLKGTLYHEVLHVFHVEHAHIHKSSGDWTQTFYEHPMPPAISGKREHPMLSFKGDGSVKPLRHGYLAEDAVRPFTTGQEPSRLNSLVRRFLSKQPGGFDPETDRYYLDAGDVQYGTVDRKILESLNEYAQTNVFRRPPIPTAPMPPAPGADQAPSPQPGSPVPSAIGMVSPFSRDDRTRKPLKGRRKKNNRASSFMRYCPFVCACFHCLFFFKDAQPSTLCLLLYSKQGLNR